MSVHLTQYLCENRHCIVGAGWDKGSQSEAEQKIRERIAELKAHPICGLCGSTKLHFETCELPFKSLAEALLPLKLCEIDQQLTALIASKLPKPN